MAVTERVTILMEPTQKARLTKQARAAGLSVGEYIRNRALDDDALLEAAAAELRASTSTTLKTIDAALARMEARERAMAAQEAAVKQHSALEFSESELQALIRLLAAARGQPKGAAAG